MSPRPSFAVSSTSAWLISSACARLSSAHGPAMSTTGRSLPSVRLPIWTWRWFISSTAPSPQPSPARGEGAHRVFPSPLAGTTRPTALRSAPRGFDRRATEPALVERGFDEAGEQRVRLERLRFELGMVLHADEPGMVGDLDDFRQLAVRRHAGEAQTRLLELAHVVDVDLVAVAMALADLRRAAVDLADAAAAREHRLVGAEPHGAAEIAAGLTLLQHVAAHPLGHEPDHRVLARPELGRARALEPGEVARRLDHRHLHAEADAEIGHEPLARETRGLDLALGAALAEAAGDEDAVDAFELDDRVLLLEDLGIEPIQIDAHIVGDAAMGQRLGQRFVAVAQMRVLADDGDVDLALGAADARDDFAPARQIGRRRRDAEMRAHLAVEAL